MTKIPWTDETWNPVVGCTKVAAGCKNCYAERFAWRLACMGKAYYNAVTDKNGWTGNVLCRQDTLDIPLHWRKPRMIFVCSMGDLFHEAVPESFIYKVLMITQQADWHTYQILTKRPGRAAFVLGKFYGTSDGKKWPFDNVWLGTSISTQADADKNIPILLTIPAAVRFVSFEPALEYVDFETYLNGHCFNCGSDAGFDGNNICQTCGKEQPDIPMVKRGDYYYSEISWLIVGCESGPRARLCNIDFIDWAITQAKNADVPVFLKQIPLNGRCEKDPAKWPAKYRSEDLRRYPIRQGSNELHG